MLRIVQEARVRLSATIMAHPVRRASAEAVQASLDRPTPIVWDPVAKPSKDKMQRWRNGRNAWQTAYDADPAADWCLVLQDDVRVADNLLAGIEAALDHLGTDGLVSAYAGTGRPEQRNVRQAIAHANKHGLSWWSTRSLNWGPAIIAPRHTIPDMLEWGEQEVIRNRPPLSNMDRCIGVYYRDILGWRTWYLHPSLVEHRDELPSLVGHDTPGTARTAHRFHEGDALAIDWGRVPQKGLPHTI